MTQLVSTPLIFPKVIPNDWNEWNRVWEKNKKFSPKIQRSSNQGYVHWQGFDIYVKEGVDASQIIKYKCENLNCPELFNSLFDNLDALPIELYVVRVVQSLNVINPHRDFIAPPESPRHSLRTMLYDDNPRQTWWYESNAGDKEYLKLPNDSNTWWYNDVTVKHSTDYIPNYGKQLIMYRGIVKEEKLESLINQSVEKYSDYAIYL